MVGVFVGVGSDERCYAFVDAADLQHLACLYHNLLDVTRCLLLVLALLRYAAAAAAAATQLVQVESQRQGEYLIIVELGKSAKLTG